MPNLNAARDERGAAAVEFAFVLPLLILLLLGIIEFGRGYHAKLTLTHAAREGARALAVGKPVAVVQTTIEDALGGLDTSNLTISGLAACTPGSIVTVQLGYDLDYSIPFWDEGTWNVDATGKMRCGG